MLCHLVVCIVLSSHHSHRLHFESCFSDSCSLCKCLVYVSIFLHFLLAPHHSSLVLSLLAAPCSCVVSTSFCCIPASGACLFSLITLNGDRNSPCVHNSCPLLSLPCHPSLTVSPFSSPMMVAGADLLTYLLYLRTATPTFSALPSTNLTLTLTRASWWRRVCT